jgi:hypothetical protein
VQFILGGVESMQTVVHRLDPFNELSNVLNWKIDMEHFYGQLKLGFETVTGTQTVTSK